MTCVQLESWTIRVKGIRLRITKTKKDKFVARRKPYPSDDVNVTWSYMPFESTGDSPIAAIKKFLLLIPRQRRPWM